MFGWIGSIFSSSRPYDIVIRPSGYWCQIMWGSSKCQDFLRETFQSTGIGQRKVHQFLLVPNPESDHGRNVVEVHLAGRHIGNIGWGWSAGIADALKGRTARVDGRIISKNSHFKGYCRYYEVELSIGDGNILPSLH